MVGQPIFYQHSRRRREDKGLGQGEKENKKGNNNNKKKQAINEIRITSPSAKATTSKGTIDNGGIVFVPFCPIAIALVLGNVVIASQLLLEAALSISAFRLLRKGFSGW